MGLQTWKEERQRLCGCTEDKPASVFLDSFLFIWTTAHLWPQSSSCAITWHGSGTTQCWYALIPPSIAEVEVCFWMVFFYQIAKSVTIPVWSLLSHLRGSWVWFWVHCLIGYLICQPIRQRSGFNLFFKACFWILVLEQKAKSCFILWQNLWYQQKSTITAATEIQGYFKNASNKRIIATVSITRVGVEKR